MQEIHYIFEPRSVAVIGASSKPGRIGHECFRSMLSSGYKGKLYPINPNANEVLGIKTYSSIKDIPGDVDLVIYALPSNNAIEVFGQLAEKKVKAVIIISGGFREVSEGGVYIEERVLEIAKKNRIRIIGPNCVGIYDSYSKVDSFFQSVTRLPRPKEGGITFISQSGTFAISFMDWASDEGVGISKVISVGNRADIDEADLIQYLNEDNKTDVIAFYAESYTNGRKLVEAIRRSKKAVVAYLASKTNQGALVAKSHTGRLASDYKIARNVIEGAGAIIADTFQHLYDNTKTLSLLKHCEGDQILMITNGAGPCVVAADLIEEKGLKMAKLQASTIRLLLESLPKYAIVSNPIDLTGSANSRDFLKAIEICDNSMEVDIIALFVVFQDTPLEDNFVEYIVSNKPRKPILVFCAGGEYTRQKCGFLNANSIPTFQSVEGLVSSAKALIEVAQKRTG